MGEATRFFASAMVAGGAGAQPLRIADAQRRRAADRRRGCGGAAPARRSRRAAEALPRSGSRARSARAGGLEMQGVSFT